MCCGDALHVSLVYTWQKCFVRKLGIHCSSDLACSLRSNSSVSYGGSFSDLLYCSTASLFIFPREWQSPCANDVHANLRSNSCHRIWSHTHRYWKLSNVCTTSRSAERVVLVALVLWNCTSTANANLSRPISVRDYSMRTHRISELVKFHPKVDLLCNTLAIGLELIFSINRSKLTDSSEALYYITANSHVSDVQLGKVTYSVHQRFMLTVSPIIIIIACSCNHNEVSFDLLHENDIAFLGRGIRSWPRTTWHFRLHQKGVLYFTWFRASTFWFIVQIGHSKITASTSPKHASTGDLFRYSRKRLPTSCCVNACVFFNPCQLWQCRFRWAWTLVDLYFAICPWAELDYLVSQVSSCSFYETKFCSIYPL